MKLKLKEKLLELKYSQSYIENNVKALEEYLKEEKFWKKEENIYIEKYQQPTEEIPKFFLNVGNVFEKVLVFDGDIHSIYKENSLNDSIQFADYSLCDKICLIGILKDKKIKILYYEPNDFTLTNFKNQTYEMAFEKKRESVEKEYVSALNKKNNKNTKKIIKLLETEYVLDYILLYDLNPKIKILSTVDEFAEEITSFTYFYLNNFELKKLEKNLVYKKLGIGVKLGNITNNPLASLKDSNQIADFSLNKLSYAWLTKDLEGEEVLLVYTAEDCLNYATYSEYKEKESEEFFLKFIEDIRVQFSSTVGYDISKDYLIKVFKRLNYSILFPPIETIRKNFPEENIEITTISYKYKVVSSKDEFEKELYIQSEDSFTGKFKFVFVESLFGIYNKIGKKLSGMQEPVNRADFNVSANAAIVKKETYVSKSMIKSLENQNKIDKELIYKLPFPNIEVVFYFPPQYEISQNVKMYNGSNVATLLDELNTEAVNDTEKESENINQIEIQIQYIDKNGNEIIHPIRRKIDNNIDGLFEEYEYIMDTSGNKWKCQDNLKESLEILKKLDKNILTLTYGVVYPNLKIISQTIYGETLKEEFVMVYDGELYTLNTLPNLTDKKGLLWQPENPEGFDVLINKDEMKEIIVKYVELKEEIHVKYKDENDDQITHDIIYNEQVGKKFDVPLEKFYQDEEGKCWKMEDCDCTSLIVSENKDANKANVFYKPECIDVTIEYHDLNGGEIRNKEILKLQIGRKIEDALRTTIKDKRGNIWKIIKNNYNSFVVKKDAINKVIYYYDIARSNVEIRFCDLQGTIIKESEVISKQIGNGFVPTPDLFIYDDNKLKWRLQRIEPALLKVKEKDNLITYWYKPATAEINILYVDRNGNEIQNIKKDKAHIGSEYVPKNYERTIYQSDQVWQLVDIYPEKIRIKDDIKENEIHFIYEKKDM